MTQPNIDLNSLELAKVFEYFPEGLVCLDLETTGLSPLVDRIIEIAAIKITPSKIEVFQTLVNPEIEIPPHTIAIHHITDDMVKDSPLIAPSLKKLNDFCAELPVVAHNAKFDAGFIVMGMEKSAITLNKNAVFCSCKFARFSFPEVPNHKLSTLVSHFGIELVNHHRATDDALASLKLFIKCLEKTTNADDLNRNGFIFNYGDFGKLSVVEIPEKLKELEKLVKEAAVIEIKYAGGNYKNQFRPVKLTSLLNTPDGNILYARCLLSDMQKSFKLKKIIEIKTPTASDIQKWLLK